MPDIGYYTLPVIPSFKGIESATQDALDKAFAESAQKTGKTYADEHEKAFRKETVENARRRADDPDVAAQDKRTGEISGKRTGEAFNKGLEDEVKGSSAGEDAGNALGEKMGSARVGTIGRHLGEARSNIPGDDT